MNRRLFLFVILISGSFLACQIFFGFKDFRSYKNISLSQKLISDEIATSVARNGFSLIPCKESNLIDKNSNVHFGVCFGNDSLFLLARNKELSSVVHSQDDTDWNINGKFSLPNGLNVFLYKRSFAESFDDVSKVFIPESNNPLPVLVVEFRNNKEPFVFRGEYASGRIFNRDFEVLGTCLVFWQSGRDYIPLGLYESTEKKMFPVDLPINRAVILGNNDLPPALFEKGEGYYVLQNEYLQLVFSERTGSIEGINLPFFSEKNQFSVINEIGFDRQIEEISPKESSFPGFPYYSSGERSIIRSQQIGGYYPLLRRGILSSHGQKTPSRYQALNIVSARGIENNFGGYRVVEFSDKHVVFRSLDGKISKEFRLPENQHETPYCFELDLKSSFEQELDLWITTGIPEVELLSNAFVPSLKTYSLNKGKGTLSKLKLPKAKTPLVSGLDNPLWVANSNGYFGIILTDLVSNAFESYKTGIIPGEIVPTRLSVIDPKNDSYPISKYPGYEFLVPLDSSKGVHKLRVYAGPLEEAILNTVDMHCKDSRTGLSPNYVSCLTFRGIFAFISEPFAKLLFLVMKFFYFLTSSWGISIILLTLFLKLILYPLNAWSIKSMRRMQKLSPYIQEIQKKYKKEPKRAQAEILELYKTNKVNPLTGCLPVVIQIPFLIAMFDLLKSSFLLRGASFIPGWIDNLAAPDVILSWKTPIFFIGNQLHLLPILLGVAMFIQQKSSSASSRSKGDLTEQQRQQQAVGMMMTALFTVMFYKFPSGLNLYWFSSILLGVLQQWITNKVLDKKHSKNEIVIKKSLKK